MSTNEDKLKELQSDLEKSQNAWSESVQKLRKRLYEEVQMMVEVEAESISQVQIITEEITKWSLKIAKNVSSVRKVEKERFEYYTQHYKIKTNASEKTRLMEADLSDHNHRINILEIHIEFLKETKRNLDNIRWAVKNKIELYNQLGIN